MNDFDDFLWDFLTSSFGYPIPRRPLHGADWGAQPVGTLNGTSTHFLRGQMPDFLSWQPEAARLQAARQAALQRDLATAAGEEARALTAERIRQRYCIETRQYCRPDFDSDIFNVKINHGFWEQYFVITADGYIPEIMRPVVKKTYVESYIDSFFCDALKLAIDRSMQRGDGAAGFGPIDFGFSFNAGGQTHEHMLVRLGDRQVTELIPRGVYAGSQAWFRQWGGTDRLNFSDGSFAKIGLVKGRLAETLQLSASVSDEVVFCVPPHLEKIRLLEAGQVPQSVLLLSGTLVHHVWPLMLSGVAGELVARLKEGRTITVLVQAAVFSALLGLFVSLCKRALNLPGRIYFFDLGQAMDVASPDTAGQWVKNVSQNRAFEVRNNPFGVCP